MNVQMQTHFWVCIWFIMFNEMYRVEIFAV